MAADQALLVSIEAPMNECFVLFPSIIVGDILLLVLVYAAGGAKAEMG
jgi:hypothetical protein